ncbi:uncharacterized protein LOC133345850 [Lethenteron reissneri]|uniref:uncharacterized protein LOC133345810 n=1 Tax=Lethenteron reissneri TaxID=7753 RepID=UPI002AB5F73F|nr:uncharacterized protein LOC133345810 [Lethenteron reissneri]XP_061412860.1 uncharacterized protein LOC133345850 [Lethenteron reissneri]
MAARAVLMKLQTPRPRLLHRPSTGWRRCARPCPAGLGWGIPGRAARQDRGFSASCGAVVDLRSDTVTRPCAAMRQAMAEARVGDDVYGEDPTVNELQGLVAELLGMEAALFVPSGTMGNLIAVMCHCPERGDEMLLGDRAHIHLYEQGASAQLGGVHARTLATRPDGTFDLAELRSKVRHEHPDAHVPRSRLLCLESSHNACGGRALPVGFLREVRSLADELGLRVHMDGARLLNAAVALSVPPAAIAGHCHSVSLCLSKGLGAPVGSVLAGSCELVARARRLRKALGGGMRQAGVVAAAGIVALDGYEETLLADHRHAKMFAHAVAEHGAALCTAWPDKVDTNIVMVTVTDPRVTPEMLRQQLLAGHAGGSGTEEADAAVLVGVWSERELRAVFHRDVSHADTLLAAHRFRLAADSLRAELGC